MFRVNVDKVFSKIQVSEVHCQDCQYLRTWVEKYFIGDSEETEVELECHLRCIGAPADYCPRTGDTVADIEGFMNDNAEMFDFIEEVF